VVSIANTNELVANGISIRRLRPPEAPGVTELVTEIYGDSYYPRDLYHPERIVGLNQEGKLVSTVCVTPDGEVVGHYALERPHLGAVAEASDAIVRPDHRHQHIMEQMRRLLREEAIREGLTGLVGYAVTNHVFTQKAEEHFGAHPCGMALGLWPQSFHNMPEPLTQRMSFAIYFKLLGQLRQVRHVATHHHEQIARIYRQFDIAVEVWEETSAVGKGEVTVECEEAVATANIQVRRVGTDTAMAVNAACNRLCDDSSVKAVTLELPLSQAGTAALCRDAEEMGFFFSGLGTALAGGEDALLLQLPKEDIDLSLIQLDHPFAKDLLGYVDRERERVR
jgi:serine/threonine-protein kinase RsbW